MQGTVWLAGVLAAPEVAAALGVEGEAGLAPGRLVGGARAGIARGGWPRLVPGPGSVPALRVRADAPSLARYAAVLGLTLVPTPEGPALGLAADADPTPPGADAADGAGAPDPALVAAIARAVLASDLPADAVARRLPQIGVVAASAVRAAATRRLRAMLPQPGEDRVERLGHRQQAGWFVTDTVTLSHARHDGGMTPPFTREVFSAGDAVVVLPWDRARDRVLVIDQFRPAMAVRGEPLPWMIEAIAGRIDAGETPAEAAIREAAEEARLEIDPAALIEGPGHYPSPGVLNEYLYSYVALTDLPDGSAGLAGLDAETEDIRAHLLPRAELAAMARAGQLPNGPLALLVLWLEAEADRIRALPEG